MLFPGPCPIPFQGLKPIIWYNFYNIFYWSSILFCWHFQIKLFHSSNNQLNSLFLIWVLKDCVCVCVIASCNLGNNLCVQRCLKVVGCIAILIYKQFRLLLPKLTFDIEIILSVFRPCHTAPENLFIVYLSSPKHFVTFKNLMFPARQGISTCNVSLQ